MRVLKLFVTFLILLLALPVIEGPALAGGAPDTASRQMVVAANPYAADAGLDILRRGGSAVDAAIAVQLVLTLVEPQSSGIGGGAFMLHYETGEEGRDSLKAYDGREVAPAAVTPDLFADVERSYEGFLNAVLGGRSVGVPGVLAMLKKAHDAHGRLPWGDLFDRAIDLADQGFVVSPRLNYLVRVDPLLAKVPGTRDYFYDKDGKGVAIGTRLRNPAYANTLRLIRDEGIDAFYKGEIARAIVDAVRNAPFNPGALALSDMAGYEPRVREPVCAPYRMRKVCGMPPPSSGGTTVLAILGLLEPFDVSALDPNSADAVHLIAEAERLAYADRGRYVADADFVPVPIEGLVDRGYLADRAKLIAMDRVMPSVEPGVPPGATVMGRDATAALPSTSHFAIIDQWGAVVSMTTSVENAFGSRLMAGGFMLNNQLTDFAFKPKDDQGRPVANRVEPGKRPRSSMAPTIVFDEAGRVRLAVGSPGGNAIIAFVAKTLVGVIDWGLDMDAAIELPNFYNRGGPTTLEAGSSLTSAEPELEARGHDVRTRSIVSGLHGFTVDYSEDGKVIRGGADSRREGVAIGD
jgi:gamma-glutamyltranspeptidase/glutathione hydrolase